MEIMDITGGCYCKKIRYRVSGQIETSFQCHCRECQYITGGNANIVIVTKRDNFKFTSVNPDTFSREDLENPVKRFFCSQCGTAIGTESPSRPSSMIIKVGTLDDPSIFVSKFAIFTCDIQDYHYIPDEIQRFDKRPPKK